MDFEAPPPFTGALEEPPDLECDVRMTVDDDDDDDEVQPPDIPIDVPCTSSPTLSPPRSPITKRKSLDVASGSYSTTTTTDDHPHPVTNGLPETIEVRIPSSSGSSAESTSQQPTSSEPQSQIAGSDQNRVEDSADESSKSSPQPSNSEKNCGDDPLDAIQQEAGEDADFDDFGDFAGVDADDSKLEDVDKASEAVESGWAEFERKDRKEDEITPTEHNDEAQTGEWNAFSTADESKNSSWSADFGEFGEAKAETSSDIPPAEISSEMVCFRILFFIKICCTDKFIEQVCPLLDDICDSLDVWNVESEIGCDEAYDISVMLDADTPPAIDKDPASFNRSFQLWLALRIVEDALALKFEWKGSGHGENLFKTLSVDPTAAGRGTLPPLSASTVLEPTPFTANGTTRRSVIISREEGAHGAKVLTSDVTASSLASKNPPTVVESPSFPQADFDWDKSGLTNPTKAANRSSALLDVDFLSANNGGGSSSTISTLQKELDQLGLSNSSTQNLKKPSSQPSMLDMLMASSTKSDRRVNRPPSELSLDARALHDQLPDIEFLRANMIMFPLGETRCSQR
ncbi:hypothetical protein ANCCAN_21515 [Ancylostoma caninum]|uniref:Aftiphilin clathrin-binding box domain-containing protein n=1 Tax=Ancylostoma caninum TaxID=29170 RepID=A0A368FNS3_ANCCA|nr:hypothetical protein ANCCAN_21515 [Ancylostoma caninum]